MPLLRRIQGSRCVVARSLNAGREVRGIGTAKQAWCWARNQFWLENMVTESFVYEWWKENFCIFRNIFQYIIRLVGPQRKILLCAKLYRLRRELQWRSR